MSGCQKASRIIQGGAGSISNCNRWSEAFRNNIAKTVGVQTTWWLSDPASHVVEVIVGCTMIVKNAYLGSPLKFYLCQISEMPPNSALNSVAILS